MRIVIIGSGPLGRMTARRLLSRGHDVVIVEEDRDTIDELAESLDCAFIQGDGSRPAVLREAGAGSSDLLICVTPEDQTNIIAALVGKSLGFQRVVPMIKDPEYEHICIELGLKDTIVPDRAIARLLVDFAEDRDPLELSGIMKAGVRFFTFVVRKEQEGPASSLALPEDTRAIFLYRGTKVLWIDPDTPLRKGDEVVLVTRKDRVVELAERFGGA